MDYKYIEQLLERYWNCQTSLEEESILRAFFCQKEIPSQLEKYRGLFIYEGKQQTVGLGEDFDEKILNKIGEKEVKARRNTVMYRLRPLYRAAAAVAIIFTLGMAAQHSFNTNNTEQSDATYNYASYKDTYTDPQVACEQVASALKEVSTSLRNAGFQATDSVEENNAVEKQ